MSGRHVVGLALVVGLVMSSCSADDAVSDTEQVTPHSTVGRPPDGTVPAITSFSFDEHDLCDWVSTDEISDYVSSQFDWDGDVAESEAPADDLVEERGNVACSWELSGNESGHITVYAPTTLGVGDETYDYADVKGVIVDGPVLGHPSLSAGVAYYQEPWHHSAFGVPASGRYLIASFQLPDFDLFDFRGGWDEVGDRWFSVVDQILSQLGWTVIEGDVEDPPTG